MATVGTIMTITDLSGNTYNIHGMLYGQCDTAAATQAKTVAIPGITSLATGLSIRVRFVYAQSYNGVPTLNVNNLGAKNIRRSSASDAAIYEWVANEILDLVYDGTYWVIVNGGKANKSDVYSKTEAVAKADVVNNLTSTATDKPGSANMLRELNNKLIPDGGHSAFNNKVSWIIMGKLCQVVIYGLAFADASQMAAAGIPAPKSGYASIICGNSNQITGKIEYANGAWFGTQLAGSTYSNGYGTSIYIIP